VSRLSFRAGAVAGFALLVLGVLATASPLVAEVSEATEGWLFGGGLLAAAAGVLVQIVTLVLLLRHARPDAAARRRVRDLCLRLGVVGMLEAVFLLTREPR